ncbi:hypothetical protein CHARACLAT_004736 [Characodon lateralis]|uniref:Uncharacterized protein n=1 Tax=Characodon lateralis TaxID=208331 RepID=A0ABU7CYV4_9TELE|nr:hypothetical protein [Characodon lateralis]
MVEPLDEASEQCCYTDGLIFIREGADVGIGGGEGSLFSTTGACHLHRVWHLGPGVEPLDRGEQKQREENKIIFRAVRQQEPGAEAVMRGQGCQAIWHFKRSMVQC